MDDRRPHRAIGSYTTPRRAPASAAYWRALRRHHDAVRARASEEADAFEQQVERVGLLVRVLVIWPVATAILWGWALGGLLGEGLLAHRPTLTTLVLLLPVANAVRRDPELRVARAWPLLVGLVVLGQLSYSLASWGAEAVVIALIRALGGVLI